MKRNLRGGSRPLARHTDADRLTESAGGIAKGVRVFGTTPHADVPLSNEQFPAFIMQCNATFLPSSPLSFSCALLYSFRHPQLFTGALSLNLHVERSRARYLIFLLVPA